MATPLRRPQTAVRELGMALAAVEAAYDRLMTAPRPDPHLLLDLQHRARELTDAAVHAPEEAPYGRSQQVRRRCAGADRGAQWIIRHCR